ncbi:MAG: sigma-70 family RNA polymerase sigma factor [Pseudomonadales bacterium]|nr:sigma-70 family RNA polymerase sigma factor [Pseudomonadales bacterium]
MAGFSDLNLEASVVAGLRAGEADALTDAYRVLAPAIFGLCVRVLGERQLAEEVMQDTFVDLMEKVGSLRDDTAVVAWVRKVAINHCLMRLRSPWYRRRTQSEPAERVDDGDGALRLGNLRDLERALLQLGAKTRLVIWLHDVEGYTHKEIGDLLGKTSSYSKSQLARGYRRLEALYGGTQDEGTAAIRIRPAGAT